MFFAGYLHARFLLLIMFDKQQRVRFCVILAFCFHLSSCDIGEPGMGFDPLSFLGSQPIAMLPVSVYLILLFHLIVVSFSSICVFISLCVASVVLVFMPGLYSAAYMAAFLAQPAEERCMWLPLVCFYFLYFLFSCLSRRCPLLTTFLSVIFCLLSLLISGRIPVLIWFDSVYLVTTAGFVADQLM